MIRVARRGGLGDTVPRLLPIAGYGALADVGRALSRCGLDFCDHFWPFQVRISGMHSCSHGYIGICTDESLSTRMHPCEYGCIRSTETLR